MRSEKLEVRSQRKVGQWTQQKKPQAFEACGLVYNPMEGIIQE